MWRHATSTWVILGRVIYRVICGESEVRGCRSTNLGGFGGGGAGYDES